MISGTKVAGVLVAAATIVSGLAVPAHSQNFGKKGGGYAGPPVENHPKVDEKAYKAALDRIPTPDKKYDPWGIARSPEPVNAGKKSH